MILLMSSQYSGYQMVQEIDTVEGITTDEISVDAETHVIEELSHLPEEGRVQNVHVVGNYAYVADENAGLEIYDITDKTNPVMISQHYDGGIAWDVVVDGSYAYVADDSVDLRS